MTVLILGATGTVGRHIVKLLAQRDVSVVIATRHPQALRELPEGARAVMFDFDQPATFAPALEGVERAFLMLRTGEERRYEVASALLAAMKHANVRHVVDMTGVGVEANDASPMRRVELALEHSGMAFTHLRPSYFMQNFCSGILRASIVERDEIAVAAGEASISFVDARDIAAVAAAALTSCEHENRAYAVTGGAGVTHAEIARAIGAAIGRPITYRPLSDDEARRALREAGMSPAAIEQRLGFLALARSGAFSRVSADVEKVLGRTPISLFTFAHEHAASWRKEAAQ
jgi:uncharacterized protein YbjT (DUF2867 family)